MRHAFFGKMRKKCASRPENTLLTTHFWGPRTLPTTAPKKEEKKEKAAHNYVFVVGILLHNIIYIYIYRYIYFK